MGVGVSMATNVHGVPKGSEDLNLGIITSIGVVNVHTADCPRERVHTEVLALGTALKFERNSAGSIGGVKSNVPNMCYCCRRY